MMDEQHNDIDRYAAYVYKFLSQYVSISAQELNLFLPFLELRTFERKVEILRYGQVEEYLNLVVKGLARKYVLLDRSERTLQLATEGHLIQSESSFHRRVPSTMIVEALEPVTIVSISYANVQLALQEIPQAEEIGRKLITYLFVRKDQKYFEQLKQSRRQRFLDYVNEYPHMLQRVPQKVLASYLEIKPETFSRMKHLLKG